MNCVTCNLAVSVSRASVKHWKRCILWSGACHVSSAIKINLIIFMEFCFTKYQTQLVGENGSIWHLHTQIEPPLVSTRGGWQRNASKEYSILDYNAKWLGDSPTFRSNMSPPSSGKKVRYARKQKYTASSDQRYVPQKCWALRELHGLTVLKN
jgi:hypothetical protein